MLHAMERNPDEARAGAVLPDDVPVIVYDGVCALCSGWVRFVLRRDGPIVRHRFVSAQSALGHLLYRRYGYDPDDPETLLLVTDARARVKSDAVLAVLNRFGGPWRALSRVTRLVPARWRDAAYDRLARNRYRLGRRLPACERPPPGTEERFLG
jgi:predicted DCC family thiol-disulfide oxidoreductase YuxK